MRDLRKISVVFSFRNEEEVLPELIGRCRSVFEQEIQKKNISEYDLVFVNDASSDKSLDVLKEQIKIKNDIKVVNMSRCFGVSPCVMAGLEYATGDAVVYMDADLQDPPEVISKMIECFRSKEDVDIVHSVRLSRKGETRVKLWITRLGYLLLNKLASVDIPIEAGDFKLLSKRAVHYLVSLKENKPFMRGLVSWIGFKHDIVHYHREPRFAGKTKFKIYSPKVIGNFFSSALISFSSVPLRVASLFGLCAIFIDFIFMVHALSEKIQGKAIPGWTALMIVILFLGGVQLFCIGIIGLYLNAVHEQTRNRPNYIVDSTIGISSEE